MNFRNFLRSAGLMAATTVGAGLFALPYVTAQAGWLLSGLYLAILSAVLIFGHSLYFRALEKVHERDRLLGLVRDYLGRGWEWLGFIVIVGGLLLALVIYLILAGEFLNLLFTGLGVHVDPDPTGKAFVGMWVFLFWLVASVPLLLKLKRLIASELLGFVLMLAVIFIIFSGASGRTAFQPISVADFKNFFLPFGTIIFALAGWTAVEPVYDYAKKVNLSPSRARRAMAWGTIASAVLYAMFVVGILGSTSTIVPDTLGGLTGWPFWKFALLIVLGLFAVWTSYVPISLEVKNALEKDLRWPAGWSIAIVFSAPLVLYLLGLRDFLSVIGLAGGIFLGLEYFLILLVSKKVLVLSKSRKLIVNLATLLFLLAAIYEVYYFVIR